MFWSWFYDFACISNGRMLGAGSGRGLSSHHHVIAKHHASGEIFFGCKTSWHIIPNQTTIDPIYVVCSIDPIYIVAGLQTPEQLASAGASRSRREKDRDEQELAKAAEMERAQKRAQLLKLTTRYVLPSSILIIGRSNKSVTNSRRRFVAAENR